DTARADVRAERLRERAGQGWGEKFTHDTANPGDADLEQMLPHAAPLTCSRSVSYSHRGASPRCSQITRTIGSVWLTRTWNPRSGQSTRRPSIVVARPSGKLSRRFVNSAGMRCETSGTCSFRIEYLG